MLVERIKYLSDKRGENLKTVAQKLGFSENAFYKWNTQNPKAESIQKVADYFNVSVDYLIGRTDDIEEVDTGDEDIRMLMRHANVMTPEERKLALKILEAAFDKLSNNK